MRVYLFILLLLLSFDGHSKKYNLQLTFVDGYSNIAIQNDTVVIRSISLGLGWSKEFVTDSTGSINFTFKAKNFIEYNFYFKSGKFLHQTRQRYLTENKDIQITFELYPSKKYEKLIAKNEAAVLDTLIESPDSLQCFPSIEDVKNFLSERFIDENLQVPYCMVIMVGR